MKKYTIYFGTGFDRHGQRLKKVHHKLRALLREAARSFGGYSLSPVRGGYINHKGELIDEPAKKLEIVTDKGISIADFVADIKQDLRQEDVRVESHSVQS